MLVYDEDSQIALQREEVVIVWFPLPAQTEQQIDPELAPRSIRWFNSDIDALSISTIGKSPIT
jgi:hypothetical protein